MTNDTIQIFINKIHEQYRQFLIDDNKSQLNIHIHNLLKSFEHTVKCNIDRAIFQELKEKPLFMTDESSKFLRDDQVFKIDDNYQPRKKCDEYPAQNSKDSTPIV